MVNNKKSKKYDLIISINPQYTKKIINGSKKYEFRKSAIRRKVKKVYIYETKPLMKIIGYFSYEGYREGSPDNIWNKCSDGAGITKEEFDSYYKNSNKAIAIPINSFKSFEEPVDPKKYFDNFFPPQTFKYIEEGILT